MPCYFDTLMYCNDCWGYLSHSIIIVQYRLYSLYCASDLWLTTCVSSDSYHHHHPPSVLLRFLQVWLFQIPLTSDMQYLSLSDSSCLFSMCSGSLHVIANGRISFSCWWFNVFNRSPVHRTKSVAWPYNLRFI